VILLTYVMCALCSTLPCTLKPVVVSTVMDDFDVRRGGLDCRVYRYATCTGMGLLLPEACLFMFCCVQALTTSQSGVTGRPRRLFQIDKVVADERGSQAYTVSISLGRSGTAIWA